MTRFTDSPYEFMMQQRPAPARVPKPTPPPKPHLCNGCKRYGEHCIRPCYRDVQNRREDLAPDCK